MLYCSSSSSEIIIIEEMLAEITNVLQQNPHLEFILCRDMNNCILHTTSTLVKTHLLW